MHLQILTEIIADIKTTERLVSVKKAPSLYISITETVKEKGKEKMVSSVSDMLSSSSFYPDLEYLPFTAHPDVTSRLSDTNQKNKEEEKKYISYLNNDTIKRQEYQILSLV